MKIDSFVIAITLSVVVAYFFPQPAHILPLDQIASLGISLIFFFYGLKLSPSKIKNGLSNWKLHFLIQGFTFLIFPLLVLLIKPFFESDLTWLSVFFLAALPSTVSSSVVMVNMAKGNMPAAIFNASISGLIGIFITPLWMGLFMKTGSADMSEIYIKLLYEILVPIVLGLFLQKYGQKYVSKYTNFFTQFDRTVILIVIYKSFVHSFETGVFSSTSIKDLLLISLIVLVLFWAIYGLISFSAKVLKLNREDRITALFCGTKKSLVHGTVFSKVLFAGNPSVGIFLLPIMLFHAFQILIIGIIANKKEE